MALYSAIQKFITKNGAPVAGASCLVLVDGSATQPTLYSGRAGGSLGNPFQTDSQGNALCFVAPGRYKMIVTKDAEQVTFEGIEVGPVSVTGTFAAGGLVSDPDQWFTDQYNNQWVWTGALNKTVAPGEDPNAVTGWVLVLEGDKEPTKPQVLSFAAGGVIKRPFNSVEDEDGNEWRWVGGLPKTVAAGTLPSSDANYKLVGDGVLRRDLKAGTVPIKHLDGTAALPSIAFASDPDTGMYRKSANQIGWSVGGLEKMVLHPSGRLTLGGADPAAMVTATLDDGGILGSAFRARANWTGSPALPYQNNDVMFLETYNNVTGDSENKSWAISSSNAYNNIPAGVVDSGTRLGVYGWAVSVNVPGYTHAGTLTYQAGIMGRAGFFGQAPESQSPAGAVIQNAIGVTGETYNDSPGTIVITAKAVQALATGYSGTVEKNYAVYAQADGGTSVNYSFFGEAGEFFNLDRAHFGSSDPLALPFYETNAKVISRLATNSFEWGFPSAGGYASTIGATTLNGRPFIAFNAQFDTGNNFKTTGLQGHAIYGDNLGSLIFGALIDQNAGDQSVVESFRIDGGGNSVFARRPILPSLAPDSATAAGVQGQVAWDANYFYVCVAANTWKRTALSTW